ncbi:acyl carrier protein [Spirillospora sp. NPDC127200]
MRNFTSEEFRARVVALIGERFALPPEHIRPETRFADLDLDSLALAELADMLEEEFGLAVHDGHVGMEDTFGDLLLLLEAEGAGR